MATKTLLAWSSGKDSAWALHVIRARKDVDVVGLLTTMNAAASRVAMHGVREALLDAQAEALGLPLTKLTIPSPCSNEQYDAVMGAAMERARADGVDAIAFGDLFLEDVRRYREERLAPTGIVPLFPLWGRPTRALAEEMIAAGLRAIVTCVDPRRVDTSLAGRAFDTTLLAALPMDVDPCAENGEFHTFAYDGPMFRFPLSVEAGTVVERDGFVFADVRLASWPPDRIPAWIPADVARRLDLSELETDDEPALRARDRLERGLACHVAAYRGGSKGRAHGLCAVYAAAVLDRAQIDLIREAEAAHPHVAFVAYARPLQPRPQPPAPST
jgi:uncharacterized protein (TIGR00290 family)